jgi:hypothetical protein
MRTTLLRVPMFLACASLVAACSSNGATPPPNTTPDLGTAGPSALSAEISIPKIAAGEEMTVCTTVQLPNETDVDIVRLQADLEPGSHHLILYRSTETVESTTATPCMPFEGIQQGVVPILIAEIHSTDIQLPKDVAYHFPPHQMVRVEAHYINVSPAEIKGHGKVTLTPGEAGKTYQAADLMLMGSLQQLATQGVPPNTQSFTLDPGFFKGGPKVDLTTLTIFALTGHEHHLGDTVTVAKSTSKTDPGTMLYKSTNWDNAPMLIFDDAHLLKFGAGEGFRWQCSYNSMDAVPKPTEVTKFGQSAITNEMCFVWAYYFPSVGRPIMGADGAFQ